MKPNKLTITLLKITILIGIVIYFTGCGKDESLKAPNSEFTCATLTGRYLGYYDPADTLDIASNCTFTDSVCGYDASYTLPASDGTIVVTVNNTNGTPGCMSSTSHVCDLTVATSYLNITCDNGAHDYLFLR